MVEQTIVQWDTLLSISLRVFTKCNGGTNDRSIGHAFVNVQCSFWSEPVILWIASVITTSTPGFISTMFALSIGKKRVKIEPTKSPLRVRSSGYPDLDANISGFSDLPFNTKSEDGFCRGPCSLTNRQYLL